MQACPSFVPHAPYLRYRRALHLHRGRNKERRRYQIAYSRHRVQAVAQSSTGHTQEQISEQPSDPDSLTPPAVRGPDGELQDLETLADSGTSSIQEIGSTVQDELAAVSDSTEAFANEMIVQETNALISRYKEKQDELLSKMQGERQIIEDQMKRIEDLAAEAGASNDKDGATSIRQKVLAGVAGLLSLAALMYGFTAVVEANADMLRNSVVDAVLAACVAYFFQKEKSASRRD